MSRKTKIIIAAGAILAVGAVAAVSQTGEGGRMGRWMHGQHGMGQHGTDRDDLGGGFRGRWKGTLTKEDFDARTRERFARFDRNNDGVIDAAEAEAATTSRMKQGPMQGMGARALERLQSQYDTNRDGKVTRDEFLAEVKRRFAEFDLDRDGRITDADLPPMMRGRNVIGGGELADMGRRGGRGMIGRLREADADRDGVVTAQEAYAAAERRFVQFDRNKDGAIDSADIETLRKETVDYRARRFLHAHGAQPGGTVTREQFAARANERFARLDRDNNGTIDRNEMPGRGHWRGRGHGGHHGEGHHRGMGDGSGMPDGEPSSRGGKGPRGSAN
jgi:Ca2+-binding EF-hand superfamily protein